MRHAMLTQAWLDAATSANTSGDWRGRSAGL